MNSEFTIDKIKSINNYYYFIYEIINEMKYK